MIIDVTKTFARLAGTGYARTALTRTARTSLVGITVVLSASLCCGHLQAAGSVEAEVKAILKINADPEYGEYLAGECLTCHKPTGSEESIPGIQGRDAGYIVTALIEYKNNTRENETMRSVAGALGNDEMAAIATYFSELDK